MTTDWLTEAVLHGKYRVLRRLGEGGMGSVYLAEHVGIGRSVALKVIRPELLADATASDRFMREARAAGGIQHRHVVNVTDFGIDRVGEHDVAYLVMEQLHGQTLEAVLASRIRLPLPQVVDIVEQVSAALTAAHARGIVHRDLKPANIWLAPDARGGFHVTLLDFGIAKLRDDRFASRPDPSPATPAATRVVASSSAPLATQVGESIGTPAYMSPEQCVGDAVDWRSDLYSFGIVVYQMIAGTLPFRGDTTALLRQHFVAEIPPLPAEAGVSPAVEAVIRRALAKEPEARFQSAAAFAASLRAHSADFGESMRRALVVFAERLPELSTLGACFALPGLATTLLLVLAAGLPWLVQPLVWMVAFALSSLIATPVAMATIAAVFGDLRERPFVRITWRGAARAVSGSVADGPALFAAWGRVAVTHYVRTSRRSNGNGLKNMLAYVDRFRHEGGGTSRERLDAMAAVLPTRAFATMAVAQLSVLLLLPLLAVLAVAGGLSVLGLSWRDHGVLIALAGGSAFTAANFLQVFIALVDVMLYDLAYAMSDA